MMIDKDNDCNYNRIDDSFPEVPINMDPCKLKEWMDAHETRTLALEDDMRPEELSALYCRHVDSPCPSIDVIGEIAIHPNTPTDILVDILQRQWPGPQTHRSLALNPSLPVNIMKRLARSRWGWVQAGVVENPNAPLDVLRDIAERSRFAWVRELARRELMPEWRRIKKEGRQRIPIEMDPCQLKEWLDLHYPLFYPLDKDMAGDQLRRLYWRHAESPCPCEDILQEIARHAHTPDDVLAELRGPRWRKVKLIQAHLSRNPSLSEGMLRELAGSRWEGVQKSVAEHPNTSVEVLERLAHRSRFADVREVAQQALAERQEAKRGR